MMAEPREILVAEVGGTPSLRRQLDAALASTGLNARDGNLPVQAGGPDQVWIILYRLHQVDAAVEVATALHREGATVLPIGEEPGAIWCGPVMRPDRTGCLACLQTWASNNARESELWCSPSPSPREATRLSQAPLSPVMADITQAAIVQALEMLTPDSADGPVLSTIRIDVFKAEVRRHPLIAWPDCPLCDQRPTDSAEAADLAFSPRPRDAPGQSRLFNPRLTRRTARDSFVDRRSGLVRHVYQDLNSNLMPLYAAEMPIVGSETVEGGYGRAETRGKSELVAILELLERFAGQSPRRTRPALRGSFQEMSTRYGDVCLDPAGFILHDEAQRDERGFGLAPYNSDLVFDWCWGYSMRQRRPVLLPQQLAYYWLANGHDRPTNRFAYDSSNGCAMGACVEEAALFGLFEVLERDAYLTTWYGRIPPRRIDLDSLDDSRSRALIARAEAQGYRIHLFDMALDIDVPAVWGMIENPSGEAPVKSYCAAAAHGQWREAIFATLVEITTAMSVYEQTMPGHRDRAEAMLADSGLVQTMADHVLLYSLPTAFDRFGFLWDGPRTSLQACEQRVPSANEVDVTTELFDLVEKVLLTARDVVIVNQTFPAMDAVGVHCVKVVAPGLHPVTFGHQHRRVSLDRIRSARSARGVAGDDINPYPHNFP